MSLTALVAALLLGVGEPGPVAVEVLLPRPSATVASPKAEVRIEADGRTTTYSGIPLAAILNERAKPVGGMAGLRELSDAVILVRGADGYQAAVSAASVAMDPKGERYLLAESRDGQPMPRQLIVPGDPKHVRWVKDVAAVRLVRLNDLVRPDP